jgi:hypothetical protein
MFGRYGYYLCCSGKHIINCDNTLSCDLVDGKPVLKQNRSKDIFPGINCPKCQGTLTKLDGKFGPYLKCRDDNNIKCTGNSKVPYENKKCNKCGNHLYLTVYDNESVLFCMGYHTTGCNFKEILPENKKIPNPYKYSKIDDVPKQTKKIFKAATKK